MQNLISVNKWQNFVIASFDLVFFPSLEVKYTIKVESERKKLNLPSRVIFNPRSANEFESTGVVELKGQGTEICVTRGLRLQVQQITFRGETTTTD